MYTIKERKQYLQVVAADTLTWQTFFAFATSWHMIVFLYLKNSILIVNARLQINPTAQSGSKVGNDFTLVVPVKVTRNTVPIIGYTLSFLCHSNFQSTFNHPNPNFDICDQLHLQFQTRHFLAYLASFPGRHRNTVYGLPEIWHVPPYSICT